MTNNDWQPIETAPKDGTYILVFDYCDNFQSIFIARYSKDWSVAWNDTDLEIEPTHWMPLPKPPIN